LENKDVFRNIISDYEAARPGYPSELYRDIVAYAAIGPDANILEIGAGPGQTTGFFVENGYAITALEISKPQVQYLEEKYSCYPNFSGTCSRFEDYKADSDSFDLIFSATAFHWIDPEIGYPKASTLLRPGGTVAVFWHLASILEPDTAALIHIRDICRHYAPELDDFIDRKEAQELHRLRIRQITAGGLFRQAISKIYRWNDVYSVGRYLKLMNSYSDFHSIDRTRQEAIRDEVFRYIVREGGEITIPQEVRLYLAKK
jgi:SAM-dependent methyltransferase